MMGDVQRIARLERILPTIQSYQIVMYSDLDWCQNLFYQQGNYMKQYSDSRGCDYGHDNIKTFNHPPKPTRF